MYIKKGKWENKKKEENWRYDMLKLRATTKYLKTKYKKIFLFFINYTVYGMWSRWYLLLYCYLIKLIEWLCNVCVS